MSLNKTQNLFEKLKSHGFLHGIFVIYFLILVDQASKYFVLYKNIKHSCNPGVAFGIIIPTFLLILIWTSVMIYVIYLWQQQLNQKILVQLPFLLIISGGLGNVIDRVIHGCVIDFIPFLNISNFNLADSFITVGVVLILVTSNQ